MKLLKSRLRAASLCAVIAAAQFFSVGAFAQNSVQRPFEDAWREYEETAKAPPATGGGQREMFLGMGDRARRLTRMALDIFEGYPKDPRRWQAAVELIKTSHGFVYDIVGDPQKDGPSAFLRDEVARSAWFAYSRSLYEQMLALPELPPATVKAAIQAYHYRLNMTPKSTLADHVAVVDEFARRFPEDPDLAGAEQRLYMMMQTRDPGGAVERMQRLLKSSNAAVREMAEGKMRMEAGRTEALKMKFTALDGREVDLEKMRGKVVLIDFWATWCGPCIQELPNVKAVYDKYHAQGFEVVAISLDSDKDKQKLIDFCRERNLPWPQHFDGRGWKNEFAAKYSVSAIPAMFLLDKSGKVASSTARGEKLEAEVKRLLAM